MPSYDYECKACGHEFEAFQTMSEDPLTECPECGERTLRRLIGGGMGIIFKGSGFYVNDSRASKSSTNGSNAKGHDGKTSSSEGKGKETADSGSGSSEKSSQSSDSSGSKSA